MTRVRSPPRPSATRLASGVLSGLVGAVFAASPASALTDCCYTHAGPGCDDPGCESKVCCFDPYCCSVEWDTICTDEAHTYCLVCTGCSLCPDAMQILDGVAGFDTHNASTGCPPLPFGCAIDGDPLLHDDIWFAYRASCDGTVAVELRSDSMVAPRLAAYTACPQDGGEFLACDGGSVGGMSQVAFTATCGATYVLRAGGYGAGSLSIACAGELCPCSPCVGDLDGNGTVDASDLALLLGCWGPPIMACADLSGDGIVDGSDLALLLAGWGGCAADSG